MYIPIGVYLDLERQYGDISLDYGAVLDPGGFNVMTENRIRILEIGNFKSIDTLRIRALSPFSVFAGSNGSGKSNFVDALDFVSVFVRHGIEAALHKHGGIQNIRSRKRQATAARQFSFSISCEFVDGHEQVSVFDYSLRIHDLYRNPVPEEFLDIDGTRVLSRKRRSGFIHLRENPEIQRFPDIYSSLSLLPDNKLTRFLKHLNVYRIDPVDAKATDKSNVDATRLASDGSNLASVLRRLESNREASADILDWMQMIVPGVATIQTRQRTADNSTALLFEETGSAKRFPANLVSDGTVYALCMLVAVLGAPAGNGMTLIEEPERGLHAKAIRELVDLMRQQASSDRPIWLTTHSESVVRALHLSELVLVDKVDGNTTMKRADSGNLKQHDLAPLTVDEAWLTNLLDGGLPW